MDRSNPSNLPLFQNYENDVYQLIHSFLLDRRSQGVSKCTLRAYTQELTYFSRFLAVRRIAGGIDAITPDTLREYLVDLASHRNPGGVHIAYRVLKTFTYWWEKETDNEYRSPIRKIKPPKNPGKLMTGISIEEFIALIKSCSGPMENRDRAILLVLFDTGVRANELVMANIGDLDLTTGRIRINHGKGGKQRDVFIGRTTRRALRKYMKERVSNNLNGPIFITSDGERLTYNSLKMMLRRRSKDAGLDQIHLPHDFRRTFALQCLRNGVDLDSIMRLMGQSSPEVLRRYINQTTDDLLRAHQRGSPADTLFS